MSNFKVGQKVKTSNAEVGVIVSKHPVISEAWNIKIERKEKDIKLKKQTNYVSARALKYMICAAIEDYCSSADTEIKTILSQIIMNSDKFIKIKNSQGQDQD